MERKLIQMIVIVLLSVLALLQEPLIAYASNEKNDEVKNGELIIKGVSSEDNKQQAEEEIIKEIEVGNAVMLMSDTNNIVPTSSRNRVAKTVILEQGEKVYYMNWSTNYFYIDGKLAYCIEPSKATPAKGDYAAMILENNQLLSKALFYLVGGPGYTSELEQRFFPNSVGDFSTNYCMSHIVLSYIYDDCSAAGDAFTGVTQVGINDAIRITNEIKALPEPPIADLEIIPARQESTYVESDDLQRTGTFKLTGDNRNYLNIPLPSGVTIHNQTTGRSATGSMQVKGGDSFYFTASTDITGTWNRSSLYGTITNEYKALIINQGGSDQTIGGWSYTIGEGIAPVSFSVKWLDYGEIKLRKISSDPLATEDGVDDNFYTLKGAVYEVIDKNGKVVDSITTDEKGLGSSKKLPYGRYTIKEKISSVGFLVDVTEHKTLLNTNSVEVTSKEEAQYGKIQLQKVDSETQKNESQGAATLEKAIYEIYNSVGTLVETLTTNNKGEALSGKLPLGNYTVREKVSSVGYLIDETVYQVKIESTNRTASIFTQRVTSKEDIIRGDVEIVKFRESKDAEEEIKTPLAGIQFTFTSKTTGEVVRTITTDKNGYATTIAKEYPRGGLVYDTYIVKEVKESVPAGVKAIEPFEVTISKESETHYFIVEDKIILSPLMVVKKDSTTGEVIAIAGTQFRILDSNKEPITMTTYYPNKVVHEIFKTDDEGKFTLPEKLEYGTYYLEEVLAPKGYLRGELLKITIEDGHLWEEPFVVEYENMPAMGKIFIHKTDAETKGNIEGAEFTITAKEDIVTGDGTIRLKKGEVADVVVSDRNGVVTSKDLFLGVYEIEETKVVAGYIKPLEVTTVKLEYENQEIAVVKEVVEVVNEPTKIKLLKVKMGEPQTPLAGVEFAFWNKEEIEGMEKEILVTDENGEIILQYLRPGTYYFQEVSTLTGYLLNDMLHEVVIDEQGLANGERVGELVIENDYTKIEISKQDITGEVELEGAKMQLRNGEDEVIREWVSGKEPYLITELEPDTYTLCETIAPMGYLIANEIVFEVLETGETQKVVMKDDVPMGRVLIHKVDEETRKALAGVEYELLDQDGKVLEKLITDESGKAISQLYPIGIYKEGVFVESLKYSLLETKALEGYELDKTIYEVVFEYVDGETPIIEVGFELTNRLVPEEPEEPTKPEEPTTPSEPSTPKRDNPGTSQTSAPKTGDNTQTVILIVLCIVAGTVAATLLYKKKKK